MTLELSPRARMSRASMSRIADFGRTPGIDGAIRTDLSKTDLPL
jgi:hypothetical protein